MREVIASGKTVEEAIENALEELGIQREDADIDILELPTKGFLGVLAGKNAKVRVKEVFNIADYAVSWVEDLLNKMDFRARVSSQSEGDSLNITIQGQNLGALIGRRGQTLEALQYLTTLVINKKHGSFVPITLDIGDYRKKREESVQRSALSAAKRVINTGRKVVLNPMSPAERRLVHMALGEHTDIVTYSIGEEPRRKVVIDKKKA